MTGRRNNFARVTDEHDLLSLELTPCAGYLYRTLLRAAPAGKPQEFELKEVFCQVYDYSLKWAKSALRELINRDLVEVMREFDRHGYRLIAWHPGEKISQSSEKAADIDSKTSRSQPSNADSSVCSYREIRETTDNPTHHPVSTNEQEGAIDSPTTSKSPEPEIEPKVIHQIEAAGFKLNSTLITIVRTTTAQIVLEAIEVTKQYLAKLEHQNTPLKRRPEAVLVAAIQGQWHPQDTRPSNGVSPMPDDFNEWFQLAKETKLVSNSSAQSDLTGHLPGQLCVYTISHEWILYEEMKRLHSLAELKDLAEKQRKATVFTPSPRLLETHSPKG